MKSTILISVMLFIGCSESFVACEVGCECPDTDVSLTWECDDDSAYKN